VAEGVLSEVGETGASGGGVEGKIGGQNIRNQQKGRKEERRGEAPAGGVAKRLFSMAKGGRREWVN
jgi:hypothetical protein